MALDYAVDGCTTDWWRNILYINNFGSGQGGENFALCIGQTWYLANDMQMFLISPLIIWPLFFLPWAGILWSILLTIGSILVPTILTVTENWPATVLLEGSVTGDQGSNYFMWNYVKPWCRFSPYIIGLILGYILHVTKKKPIKLNHVSIT